MERSLVEKASDAAKRYVARYSQPIDTILGVNHERVAVVYAKAQDAAVLYLHAKPKPCD